MILPPFSLQPSFNPSFSLSAISTLPAPSSPSSIAPRPRGHKSFGIVAGNKDKNLAVARFQWWRRGKKEKRKGKFPNKHIRASLWRHFADPTTSPEPVACVPCALLTQPPENVNAACLLISSSPFFILPTNRAGFPSRRRFFLPLPRHATFIWLPSVRNVALVVHSMAEFVIGS